MAEAAIAAVVIPIVVDKDNSVWAGRKLSCSAIFGCHSISHQIAFDLGKTALKVDKKFPNQKMNVEASVFQH